MDRPIVLCGFGRMGVGVLDTLHAAGLPVVVIDTICQPGDARLRGARLVQGDCRRREVLEQAGVATARGVLLLTSDDLLNVSTALTVRGLNRDVRIVVRMFNQNLLGRLGQAVHHVFALSTSLLTAPILAMTALTGQALGTFRLDDSSAGLRQLVEETVGPTSPARDHAIATVEADHGVTAVAHLPAAGDDRLLLAVDREARLAAGDRLVVYGEPHQIAALLAAGPVVDAELRWAGWLRRIGRIAWRTIVEMDRAVLICFIVLLVVVMVSTVVLHFGVTRYGLADALLRTVSIMATGASLHEEEYPDSPTIRIYVSFLRISGAVLMAAFTAIVTNYLIRARLGGVLEVRRVPESGHVIVCGLSTVGFRVVEELVRLGESVVVIERDAAHRFVSTARRLGAAVMIGDAAVIEVLRQGHAAEARAVVAATNNDMTNLEIALLVRELNANQRVALLLNDPALAQMLRDAAGIRLAVSVPALAAPAFVAALFGDRVVSVFLLRERLFAVLDLLINDEDPFVGHAVRAVAVDYRILPLDLLRGGEPVRPFVGHRLHGGDRLIGLVALNDLERLLRRQPASADCAVEVTAYPVTARSWLTGLLRVTAELSAEQAEAALERLPVVLATNLTRGQAEDLHAQLARERVTAVVRPVTAAG